MTGLNTMELNEATMRTIVQFWLDNKFLNRDDRSPKVISVKGENTHGCNTFQIEPVADEEKKAA